jgi:hypothetical protein
MTKRTRQFVMTSLLVLVAGVGTGFVAYFGLPATALTAASGPDELRFIPSGTALVAFANVNEVMTSELRQKLRGAPTFNGQGQKIFQDETGINIETDIDRVVFALMSPGSDAPDTSGLVVARGRFDVVRIERAMRDRGTRVDEYKGKRILSTRADGASGSGDAARPRQSLSLAFVEPGLVIVGNTALIRRAIDLKDGGESVLANNDIMARIKGLAPGNVWAVGRVDALTSGTSVAAGMAGQLQAITWFSASGQMDSGLAVSLNAEARDEQSANGLRDMLRGLMAFARMQTASRPELQSVFDGLQLGGNGQTVTMSATLSPQLFDTLAKGFQAPVLPRPRP